MAFLKGDLIEKHDGTSSTDGVTTIGGDLSLEGNIYAKEFIPPALTNLYMHLSEDSIVNRFVKFHEGNGEITSGFLSETIDMEPRDNYKGIVNLSQNSISVINYSQKSNSAKTNINIQDTGILKIGYSPKIHLGNYLRNITTNTSDLVGVYRVDYSGIIQGDDYIKVDENYYIKRNPGKLIFDLMVYESLLKRK